jgi:hypothetical protein
MKSTVGQIDTDRPKRVEIPPFAIVAGFAVIMPLLTISGYLTASNF